MAAGRYAFSSWRRSHRFARGFGCAAQAKAEAVPARERSISYGKYKGELLGTLPDGYLRSLLKKPLWAGFAKEVLDERKDRELEEQALGKSPLVFKVGEPAPLLYTLPGKRAAVVGRTVTFPSVAEEPQAEQEEECVGRGRRRRRTLVEAKKAKEQEQQQQQRDEDLVAMPSVGIEGNLGDSAVEGGHLAMEEESQFVSSDDIEEFDEEEEEEDEGDLDADAVKKQYRQCRAREISEFLKHRKDDRSLKRLERIVDELELQQIKLDSAAYGCLVQWCGNTKALSLGKRTLAHMMKTGQVLDRYLRNMLVEMYGKCRDLEGARAMFEKIRQKNVFSWSIMVAAFAQSGQFKEALQLFGEMDLDGLAPSVVTFVSALRACAGLRALREGREIHESMVASWLHTNVVAETALLNMYSKCASLEDAKDVFSKMKRRDVVSYNAMIAAFSQLGHGKESLELYQRMDHQGIKPDEMTFGSVLHACESLGALKNGKTIHERVAASGYEKDVVVSTALVNMYGKCGMVDAARRVFDTMQQKNVVSWTAMVATYAQNGHVDEALKLFRQMDGAGVKPDEVTFTSVLFACSHAGLVEEGWKIFASMSKDHGVAPSAEHYGCMIDLLGRMGRLSEAENLIKEMSSRPSAVIWMTLLGACKSHGDIERGVRAAEHVFELDPTNAAAYVLLSNLYAAAGKWDDAARVRKLAEAKGVKKEPGRSWIEVNNRVHEFVIEDASHPQLHKVYAELQRLNGEIVAAGYVPDTKVVMHNLEENEKRHLLCCHSEKLAIGFGLISTPQGTPLRIVKNLRACFDCHAFTKFVTGIVGREITVRDANRFHHFKDGACSCGDYW